MSFCQRCGAELAEGASFCTKCGSPLGAGTSKVPGSNIIVVTTQSIPGYRVKSVLGIVAGITARTRGVGGKFVAGFQSMVGGEVSAFTSEIEKARVEAIERMKDQARALGANAIAGLDMETSEIMQGTVLISATGTALVLEPEQP